MSLIEERDQYIASLRATGRSPQTIRVYQERLGRLITYLTQTFYPLDSSADLQLAHIQHYHDHLINQGLSPTTRRLYLSTAQRFLQHATPHATGRIPDWFDQIEVPKRPHRLPPTALSTEDIHRLITANPSPRNRAILTVMYACGLRRSEVVALNVGDLFPTRQQLLVHGKGSKDRIVPIAPAAIQAIHDYLDTRPAHPASHDPLFVAEPPREPSRLTSGYLNGLFRRMPNPTGRKIHPHLLRHTYAVHLLRGGADVRHVQALMGHASPDTTNQYLGLVKDEIKRAYDRAMRVIVHRDKPNQSPLKQAG